MTPSNTDIIQDFIELNPRCTRKMLMEATRIEKCTLRKNLVRMKNMLIVEYQRNENGKLVELYTINPHYDAQKVVIKKFEPVQVKHHPVMAHFYGIRV